MRTAFFLWLAALVFCTSAWAGGRPDSLTVVSVDQESKTLVKSATGVWWPVQPKSSKVNFPRHAAKLHRGKAVFYGNNFDTTYLLLQ